MNLVIFSYRIEKEVFGESCAAKDVTHVRAACANPVGSKIVPLPAYRYYRPAVTEWIVTTLLRALR